MKLRRYFYSFFLAFLLSNALSIAFAASPECVENYAQIAARKNLARAVLTGSAWNRTQNLYRAMAAGILTRPKDILGAGELAGVVFRNNAQKFLQSAKKIALDVRANPRLLYQTPAGDIKAYGTKIAQDVREHGWNRLLYTTREAPGHFSLGTIFGDPIMGTLSEIANQIRYRITGKSIPRARGFTMMATGMPAWGVGIYFLNQHMQGNFEQKHKGEFRLGAAYLERASAYGHVSISIMGGLALSPFKLEDLLHQHLVDINEFYMKDKPLPRYQEFADIGLLKDKQEMAAFDLVLRQITFDYFQELKTKSRGADFNLENYFEQELEKRLSNVPILSHKTAAEIAILKLAFQPQISIDGVPDSHALYAILMEKNYYPSPKTDEEARANIRHLQAEIAHDNKYGMHPLDIIALTNQGINSLSDVQAKVAKISAIPGFPENRRDQLWRSDHPVSLTTIPVETTQKTQRTLSSEAERVELLFSDARFSQLREDFKSGKLDYNHALAGLHINLSAYNELYQRQRQSEMTTIEMGFADGTTKKVPVPLALNTHLCALRGAHTGKINPIFDAANEIASIPAQMILTKCLEPALPANADAEKKGELALEIDMCGRNLAVFDFNNIALESCTRGFIQNGISEDSAKACIQHLPELKKMTSTCAFVMADIIWQNNYMHAETLRTTPGAEKDLKAQLLPALTQALEACKDPDFWKEVEESRGGPIRETDCPAPPALN